MDNEIWIDIHQYEGIYQVSSLGRIRSVDRLVFNGQKHYFKNGRILKVWTGKTSAYQQISLSHNGHIVNQLVHRIVAEHFLSDWDKSLEVNHIDGDKHNNSVANLEMCTRQENILHSIKRGLKQDYGEKSHNSKLTNEEAFAIRIQHSQGVPQKSLAARYRVCKQTICDIVHNKKYIR